MRKKLRTLLCTALLLLCALPVTAGADTGPKDKATIYLVHPPAGNYYIDLLYVSDDTSSLYDRNHYDSTAGTNGAQLRPADQAVLRDAPPTDGHSLYWTARPHRPGRRSTTRTTSSSTAILVCRMRSA